MGKNPTTRWMSKEKCVKLQERFGDYKTYEKTGGGRGENKKSIIEVLIGLATSFKNVAPSVLEIGSGPGHFLWVMNDKGRSSSITGVDNSSHMLEIAKDVFFENNIKANLIEGSCWNIPLDDNSYDLVFQVDVCMHIGGSYESLCEMIRVAKHFVVFTGPSFEEKDFDGDIDKQIGKISWAISVPMLNKELDKMISDGKIKKYYYKNRPKTDMYKHRILVIEK